MAIESSFVQPAIPKLDRHYDHWCMLMENFLRSEEYWSLIEQGIPKVGEERALTEGQRKAIEDAKLKDLKRLRIIYSNPLIHQFWRLF